MSESIQHKLDRVRPPRVQITYDVQIGDAFEVKELPFVVGVMADLSGELPEGKALPKLRDRQFVQIDRDSFREILVSAAPRANFKVDNLLRAPGDGTKETPKLEVTVSAEADKKLDNSKPLDSLLAKLVSEDPLNMFHPLWIIRHTPELNTLYEARTKLTDLLNKLDGNEKLGEELKAAVASPDKPKDLVLDASTYPQVSEAKPQLTEGTQAS